MGAGKPETKSQIADAIALSEDGTTGEIRVHISRKLFEKDPFSSAEAVFQRFSMFRTTDRNAVLFYINLRKKKFAVMGDEGIDLAVGQTYWAELADALKNDLTKMSPEKAITLAVCTVGVTLQKYFPKS